MNPTGKKLRIRAATPEDVSLILKFIQDLAAYENLEDQVTADAATLEERIFGRRMAQVLLAEIEGLPAGFALFFHNFSTFTGKEGIYLEDLFVRPEYRGTGVGSALLRELAKTAIAEDCARLEWSCLDWNQPSIDFYLDKGAVPMNDWTTYRVDGDRLYRLAGEPTPTDPKR